MIKHPQRFAAWLPAQFDGEFGWDFLAMAFRGTKIMPMDFDAVIERRGHYLVFETKAKGRKIDAGQAITLTGLWQNKGFTIIHVEGKTAPEITGFAVYSEWQENKSGSVGEKPIVAKDSTDLLYAVRCWFCRASGESPPTREDWDNNLWLDDYATPD